MKTYLNHIAFLVESLETVAKRASLREQYLGKIEEFPSEGTRELYLGKETQSGKVLLMQSIGPGPYANSLKKRGPGLHHIAIDVNSVESFLERIAGSGWLLHPKSLSLYKKFRQVFLCRPGVSFLVEVQESKISNPTDYFVKKVEVPVDKSLLLDVLNCEILTAGQGLDIQDSNGSSILSWIHP